MKKVYDSAAERQKAYRERQKARLAQTDGLPLMGRSDRAELSRTLRRAVELLERYPDMLQIKRRVNLETPQEQGHRRAGLLKAFAEALDLW